MGGSNQRFVVGAILIHVRPIWWVSIVIVIGLGVASRIWPLGWLWYDKYLGDALYAVLFYLILCLIWPYGKPWQKGIVSVLGMLLIETFQLTGIPRQMRYSGVIALRLISIILGIGFSWLDIFAYLIGILLIVVLDARKRWYTL